MKLRVKKSTTIVSAGLATLGLLVTAAIMLSPVKSADAQVQGGRLITVHDRGAQTSFISTKDTLKEALAEHDIQLSAKDAIEPSADEKLVAPDYQVNIYRSRPVTVIDGATRQKIVTPYQTAARIAQDAGVTLYPEDETTLTRSSDIVSEGAGLQLRVKRATLVTVDLYGKTDQLRTQATTVNDFLKEKKINLGSDGRVSIAGDTPIAAGMSFRIWREGKQTITVDEAIAFDTEQIKDEDRPVGYKQIQTVGKAGKKSVTYEVQIQNGKEVARTEIASVTLEEATKQVEVIGAKTTLQYTGGGTKTDWLAASNISQDNWGYADFMVGKESGWNPNATNRSSGACGLAQALPCSKVPGNPYNPVDSLNWMNGYVNRYGGWEGAYNFWLKNRWY